mgnify:CR=1 FL=1
MYRIAMSRLLVMMRLVMIVSLAGYSLSNASAAMHGSSFPEMAAAVSETDAMQHHDGHDMTKMAVHDHSQGEASGDADGVSKPVKRRSKQQSRSSVISGPSNSRSHSLSWWLLLSMSR